MEIKTFLIIVLIITLITLWIFFKNSGNHPPDDNYPMW